MTTKIEWADAVWNTVTGCSHVSEGCRYCYAEREFPRLAGNPKTPAYQGRTFTDVACHPERLDEPLRRKKPTRYLVNSMSDLFHEAVPFEFIDKVFAVMALAPRHTFIILTKRPERALEYLGQGPEKVHVEIMRFYRESGLSFWGLLSGWPLPNVWGLVSVEDQKTADERLPLILECPFAVRGASYEPALSGVDFTPWLPGCFECSMLCGWRAGELQYPPHVQCDHCGEAYNESALKDFNGETPCPNCGDVIWSPLCPACRDAEQITTAVICHPDTVCLDWIVAGGESGPQARPSNPAWFRKVRDDCIAAGTAFFMKQMHRKGPIPDDLMVRQFPEVV